MIIYSFAYITLGAATILAIIGPHIIPPPHILYISNLLVSSSTSALVGNIRVHPVYIRREVILLSDAPQLASASICALIVRPASNDKGARTTAEK